MAGPAFERCDHCGGTRFRTKSYSSKGIGPLMLCPNCHAWRSNKDQADIRYSTIDEHGRRVYAAEPPPTAGPPPVDEAAEVEGLKELLETLS